MSEEAGPILSLSSKRKNSNFTQISNEFLQDSGISLACKGFICFCLSFPSSWKISIPAFRRMLGIGDTSMRSLLKEAMELGYVKRESYLENSLRRWRYEISDWPEFKKCLPYVDCPRLGGQGLGSPRSNKEEATSSLRSSVSKKEESILDPASPPVSADAEYLCDFFLTKIKERLPNFKEPRRDKWLKEIDLMLRKDKRSLEETKKLIVWASEHTWWKGACLSAVKLRKAYDEMVAQMTISEEKDLAKANRNFMYEVKNKHPEVFKSLTFDNKYVYNRDAGKEVGFFLPEETFRRAFVSLFGGSYNGL